MRTFELIRSTSFSLALVTVGLLTSALAAHAAELEGPIYLETYRGEEVYPTSADIDRLQLGGMEAFSRGGDPNQTLPQLNGDSASASATSVGGFAFANEVSGAGVRIGDLLDRGEPVAVTSHFDGFHVDASSTPGSFPGAYASAFTAVTLTAPSGYVVSASLFQTHDGRGRTLYLNIAELDGVALRSLRQIQLPGTVDGVPFETTLVIDPVERTAFTRLRVNQMDFETPAIPLTALDGQHPLALSQMVGVANASGRFDFGPGDTASVQLKAFCISGLRDNGNVCRRHGGP